MNKQLLLHRNSARFSVSGGCEHLFFIVMVLPSPLSGVEE
jgi:hypothetical protein